MKAVFLDRDGTITYGTPRYERVDSLDKVELLPKTLEALSLLADMDYGVFIVTNQAGLAEGRITMEQFEAINDKVLELIEPTGIVVFETYLCPHGINSDCECQKPKPKLLFDAAEKYDIDLSQSWMIGDRPSDVMTGVNAGAKGILVRTGVPTVVSSEATVIVDSLLEAIEYIATNSIDND
jgi:D-glycero-D-manno-heptose 1,7-bisphosphate phosphatase